MAVAIRSSTKNYTASAQTITITTPSGAVAGDMLVAFLYADGSAAAYNWSADVPADWTLMQEQGPTGAAYFATFRRLLPSGTPPASYVFNIAGATNLPLHAIMVALNPNGAAFDTPSTSKSGAASVTVSTTGAVTGVSGDSVLLCGFGSNNNKVISSPPASMTELQFSNQTTGDVYVYGQLTPGSGSITKSATWDTTTSVVALAVLFPMLTGPTITVQPANDVGIISNGQSTVYTATATGTNVDAPTWYEDASPIADGGIYDIVTTGAGTSSCTSTLTITRTVKTGTPFDIKANFADDNGNTDTNTVTDTWWTGPVLTTFPATNGSGVSTATLTCDYVTGVGEAIEVRIPLSDGDVAVTVTTT